MNEQSREQQLVSAARDGDMDAFEALVHPVSYTHLTLPTICSV